MVQVDGPWLQQRSGEWRATKLSAGSSLRPEHGRDLRPGRGDFAAPLRTRAHARPFPIETYVDPLGVFLLHAHHGWRGMGNKVSSRERFLKIARRSKPPGGLAL